MILYSEINRSSYPVTPEIDANLQVLLKRMNELRTAWGKPMIVTSGLRSQADQEQLIRDGISKARKSHHLTGQACDILDISGSLYVWCKQNEKLLEQIGLWCEEKMGPWVHYQSLAPKSGKRWFYP